MPITPKGTVGLASWWSDKQVQTVNGEWCGKPPPYAAPKRPLPDVPPGDDKPALTTELAKKHASRDNMLIATYVNYNRLDFAYTFVKHLIALGNPHFLVGALDDDALRGLQKHGIPSFLIDTGLTTKDYGWGTYAFRQLGLHKVQLVLNLAKTGVNALTVDADAFILRDPFPYIRNLPTADVLMSSDHLVATNGYKDDGLEGASGFYSAFNIGCARPRMRHAARRTHATARTPHTARRTPHARRAPERARARERAAKHMAHCHDPPPSFGRYIYIRANAVEFVENWRDTCWRRKNDWDQVS